MLVLYKASILFSEIWLFESSRPSLSIPMLFKDMRREGQEQTCLLSYP